MFSISAYLDRLDLLQFNFLIVFAQLQIQLSGNQINPLMLRLPMALTEGVTQPLRIDDTFRTKTGDMWNTVTQHYTLNRQLHYINVLRMLNSF